MTLACSGGTSFNACRQRQPDSTWLDARHRTCRQRRDVIRFAMAEIKTCGTTENARPGNAARGKCTAK